MEKNSKIYIAGHKGLVGSAILRRLQSSGYSNFIVRTRSEIDLTRQTDVENFFDREKPEYVFLAAAKVGGIVANNTYRAEFIYQNIMIAANVIHSAFKYKVKKLLNLGSSCIYPKFAPQPIKEEHLLTSTLEPTNEPYAVAKISALKLCRYYNEQYGTNFISFMPTNLYGPNDNFNLETAHVIPSLMQKFHLAKLLRSHDLAKIRKVIQNYSLGFGIDKETLFKDDDAIIHALNRLGVHEDYVLLWGSGEPFREFLYADDMADASMFFMEKFDYKDIGEIINIGTGKDLKIKELAVIVKDVIGFEGEIRHDLTKPDGPPKKLLDVSKIKSLGWEAKTSLQEGIKKVYEWYLRSA